MDGGGEVGYWKLGRERAEDIKNGVKQSEE